MTDHWAAVLADPAVSESGGAHNNEGVDYARYLAMALLVQLESNQVADYAFLFEYLQDVAYLNSSTMPTEALLIQVKKKHPGQWSKAELCRVAKPLKTGAEVAGGPKPEKGLGAQSVLGKLYLSVDKLTPAVSTKGVLLTNASFNLVHKSGSRVPDHSRTSLSDLHVDDAQHVEKRLKSELKLKASADLSRLMIEQSRLIPASMRDTVTGMLTTLLEQRHPELPNISGRLREGMLEAFSKRSGPSGPVTCFADIVQKKGFTQANYSALLNRFGGMRSSVERLNQVIADLKAEGMPARAADRLLTHSDKLRARFVNQPHVQETVGWATAVDTARLHIHLDTYSSMLDVVVTALESRAEATKFLYVTEGGAQAVALLAIMYVDQEPTPASPVAAHQIT